jgi:hypothetical protein
LAASLASPGPYAWPGTARKPLHRHYVQTRVSHGRPGAQASAQKSSHSVQHQCWTWHRWSRRQGPPSRLDQPLGLPYSWQWAPPLSRSLCLSFLICPMGSNTVPPSQACQECVVPWDRNFACLVPAVPPLLDSAWLYRRCSVNVKAPSRTPSASCGPGGACPDLQGLWAPWSVPCLPRPGCYV